MKRVLAILLAMAMLFSTCAVLALAGEESPIFATLNVDTIDQSGEDQEVTLTVSASSPITANAFNFTVDLPEGFTLGGVAGDGLNVDDEELTKWSNLDNNVIIWESADLENKELTTLAVLTIIVPANCDATEYTFTVTDIAASKDYSTEEIWETGNDYEASATLTVEVAIASIEVSKTPVKGEYYEGQKFDPTGMEITVHYTDGTSQTLTTGFTYEPNGQLTPEDAIITISYEDATVDLPVSVKPHANHEWTETARVPATLAKTGKIVYTCECGEVDETVIPVVKAQPDELEPIPSTVVIDGKFDDTIWNDAWIEVDGDNGFYQALPTTDDTLSYSYQVISEGGYMYVAVIVNKDLVVTPDAAAEGNGNGTNVRLWLHNGNKDATVYTSFYDVFVKADGVHTQCKQNGSLTGNSGVKFEGTEIEAAYTNETGYAYFEFCVPLAEFGGENGFKYHMAVSNKVNENLCLFFPSVELPEGTGRTKVLPYTVWLSEAEPADAAELINIDGKFDDGMWNGEWIDVNGDNGFWQALPTTDDLSYSYQIVTAGDYMYVAVIVNKDLVVTPDAKAEGNGNGTNIRLWLHNGNKDATVYTSFYDVFVKADGVHTQCKQNGSLTGNSGVKFEGTEIEAAYTNETGYAYFEFCVPLAEFGGEDGYKYHMAVSNKVNENICLFYPSVALPEGAERKSVLPYTEWLSEATATEIATSSNLVFIKNAGCHYAANESVILAGDNMTVAELVALGNNGTAKNLNYFYLYVCDAEGNVLEEYEVLGEPEGIKSNVVCPEGGFILGFHGNLGKPEIDAGDKLTVHNVLIENMRGVADWQKLTNAFVEIHKHNYELIETVAPTLAKEGYDVCKCSDCGKEIHNNVTPIVPAQPEELEEKPVGATNIFALNYAGMYFDADLAMVLAGNNGMTIAELVELGNGASNELDWWKVLICDEDGIVLDVKNVDGSHKGSLVVPDDGFAVVAHGSAINSAVNGVKVGDKIILHNVLIDDIHGVADNQTLTNAWAEVHKHNFVKGETVAPTLAKEGYTVYTCEDCTYSTHMDIVPVVRAQKDYENPENLARGAKEDKLPYGGKPDATYNTSLTDGVVYPSVSYESGNWYAVHSSNSTDNVGVINLDLGEANDLTAARIFFVTGKGSGIMSPGGVKIELSSDGTNYTEVVNETYGASSDSLGTAWYNFSFKKTNARYARVSIKNQLTFAFLNEIEFYGEDAPVEVPADAFVLNYAGFRFEADITALLMGYADKDAKISELAFLGGAEDDSEADLNYFHVVICDKDGKVVKVLSTLGRPAGIKSNEVVPAGGFAVVGHGGKGSALDKVKVGDVATIGNVLTENIRGVADNQKMTDAFVTFHSHDYKFKQTVAPTLAKKGYSVYECSCGETENRDETPVVKAQPDELEELPDGAKTIGFAGAKYAGGVSFVLAGDNMTVKELVALGNDGAGKDLHYFFIYVVDKDGVVVEVNENVGEVAANAANDKSNIVCPEGGFILAVHNDCGKPTGIEVGKLLTLHNVDLEAMRGVADNQALTNAFYTVKDKFLKGDVNGDGNVDAFDYQMLKAYVLGNYPEATEAEIERMKINDDDIVDAFDFQMLKAVVLGNASFDD